ncbi:MAG: class I SAM-dependent methyltransferase [Saprospiraceae bacterium]
MKQLWNERYNDSEYIYGTEPNAYFKEKITPLTPGRLLLPAEGEGRNAVFAAKLGWAVTAFDWSIKAQAKAIMLAEVNQVEIDYWLSEVEDLNFEVGSFDAVAFIYAHFSAELKSAYNRKIATFLKPGGVLIFEAFSKKQSEYQQTQHSGGPQDRAMLYSLEEVRADFADFHFLELEEKEVFLAEGPKHHGLGSVIRALATKR